MPYTAQLSPLIDFLQRQRLDAAREKRAQAQLNDALTAEGWTFEREYPLGEHGIVDFLVSVDGYRVALELKARAQRMRIYRQLERYAEHEDVDCLLLLTGTAMALPATINDKPAGVISLGGGWL